MEQIEIPNDGFGNWCPVCGEPREVCQCDGYMPEEADDFDFLPDDDDLECPKCHSNAVEWQGGDSIVNVGNIAGPLFSRVNFYQCRNCGEQFAEGR